MTAHPRRLVMAGFRPGPGGTGRVMTTLMDALLARGVEIDLLLPEGEHPDLDALRGEVGCFRLDGTGAAARAALLDHLRWRRPRAVLSNKDQTHRLLRRSVLQRALGAERPICAFRIGTNVPERLRRTSRLSAPWKRFRLGALYRNADVLIGNSTGVSAALRTMLGTSPRAGRGGPLIETIFNPVDAAGIARLGAEPAAHPWLEQRPGPIVVSVGRLVRAKHFELLLEAFAQLPSALGARLMICGEGGQHQRLLALAERLAIADRVELLGHQHNPFRFMAAADLYVCSSLFEGANNALIEALALGIPCVSTDCPSGARDILDGGRLGPLVPVGDAAALARAMRAVLAQPPARARLRASAGRFDPADSARRYAEVLGLQPRRESPGVRTRAHPEPCDGVGAHRGEDRGR